MVGPLDPLMGFLKRWWCSGDAITGYRMGPLRGGGDGEEREEPSGWGLGGRMSCCVEGEACSALPTRLARLIKEGASGEIGETDGSHWALRGIGWAHGGE